jgi:flavin reductase (DIM6/NTAB) family NADH-FMN oxidoreductase RutF
MSLSFGDFVGRADAAALIVTAFDGRERSGCLVGFASQCSIEPPRLVVWLSIVNHTYGVAERSERLAVHLIPAEESALAARFAEESGDWADKFAFADWSEGPGGVPLLDACPDRVVGRVAGRVEAGGDHDGFVLDPERVDLSPSPGRVLRLGDVADLHPGHPVD